MHGITNDIISICFRLIGRMGKRTEDGHGISWTDKINEIYLCVSADRVLVSMQMNGIETIISIQQGTSYKEQMNMKFSKESYINETKIAVRHFFPHYIVYNNTSIEHLFAFNF